MRFSEFIKVITFSALSIACSLVISEGVNAEVQSSGDFVLQDWNLSTKFDSKSLYTLGQAVEAVHKIADATMGPIDEFTSLSERDDGHRKVAEVLSGKQIGIIYPCNIKYLSEQQKFNTFNMAKPIKRAKFYKVDVVSEVALHLSELGDISSRSSYRVQNVFGAQSEAVNVARTAYSVGFSGVKNNGGLIKLLPDPYNKYYGTEAIVRSLVPMEGSQAREQKDDLACAIVLRFTKPYIYTYEEALTGGGGVATFKGKGIYGDIVGHYVFNKKTNVEFKTVFP